MALNALDTILRFESGGKNVNNYLYGQPGRTASGYFQMVDSTWKRWSAGAGVSGYARAIDAPYDVQRQVANYGFQTEGFNPWTCPGCNTPLRNYVASQGGAGAFSADDLSSGGGYTPAYENFSQNGAMQTPNNITAGDVSDPYGFSGTDTSGFSLPDGGSIAEWGAIGNSSGPLQMTIKKLAGKIGLGGGNSNMPSKTVPQAIDKQTAGNKADTESTLKTYNELYKSTASSFADYIVRIIFVVVGLVVFAAALRLFGGPKQIVQQVTKKLA